MKIAIIGTGIAGTGIAHLLHHYHDLTIYEKSDTPGGHSRTVVVDTDGGKTAVDTGFIVFNKRNYPLLTALFKQLGVPIAKTNMSFGADIDNGWLQYGTYYKLRGLFAQKRNLFRPAYLKMLADIIRFNRNAYRYIEQETDLTLGELLTEMKLGKWFRDYYLLAMGAAIWSTPSQKMLDFPALTFLRFFDNHGLLTVADHPQWYTVIGGSREYVHRITEPFKQQIKLNCAVQSVERRENFVTVTDQSGHCEHYDEVVFACHSDQALRLLKNPTSTEQDIIGAIQYQTNEMFLHTDTRFMPARQQAWSSWVYQSLKRGDHSDQISLSYWMNNLQPLQTQTPLIVTLNPANSPAPEKVLDRHTFEHPVFNSQAVAAQARLDEIQGKDRIWYCGAWQRYGFHEDGLWSAVNVAGKMGIKPRWI
ncbi:NAD(P)/FAD-dependent oxidoreductase [Gynuella sp.]|uniref:NAD(P)/FAD-dependent oxidoreductase n=1 Tax=Gynuella sp. TaxID=2969146 RepID=UPI003D0CCFAC